MTTRRMPPSCPLLRLAARTATGRFLPCRAGAVLGLPRIAGQGQICSGREAERDHIAVLDEVVAALNPEPGPLASAVVAARLDELLPGHDLGSHEAALH